MKRISLLIACLAVVVLSLMFAVAVSADGEMMLTTTAAPSSNCLTCHDSMTPGIVESFAGSKMASVLDCTSCHGNHHADKTSAPTIDTCAKCHADKVAQYKEGKHALAWDSMVACPVSAGNSDILTGLTNSMKGCNQCHTVGIISDELIAENTILIMSAEVPWTGILIAILSAASRTLRLSELIPEIILRRPSRDSTKPRSLA